MNFRPHPKPAREQPRRRASNSTLPAARKPLAKFSAKRRHVYETQYLPRREHFLESHPYCEMRIKGICTRMATEVQHMVQRSLDPSIENLLDESMWLAACHDCNTWAGTHPAEARLLGVEVTPRERDERRAE